MKCLKIIILFISSFVYLHAMHESPVRTEDPIKREQEKSELSTREKEIEAQKEKIEKLEAEKKYSDAKNEGESLKKLLDQQIKDLRKFSIDFPSERESANIDEGKVELEKKAIEEKIVRLTEEIKASGTDISTEPTIEKVEFSIFQEGIKNDKTVSSKWKDRLELFYNKIKLKINELPVIGNPKKVISLREKLNGIYDSFDQIEDQIDNLQNWEDYLINSAIVERDYRQVQERLVAIQSYINRLENINKRIANNEVGADDEKLTLQQKALSEIVLKTAFDLMQFSEEFKRLENTLAENQMVKKTVQNTLQNIQISMNDLLNEKFLLNDYFKTDGEKKQIIQNEVAYVRNFLKDGHLLNFRKLTDRFATTLATQPAGIGIFANFPEYKELRTYLDAIDGLDAIGLANSKELQDWEMDAFAASNAEAYNKIAESLSQRYDMLSKVSPRTATIKAEMDFINEKYQKLVDGLEIWLPLKEAFEYKIIANSALKGPKNEQEKIVQDNLNVNTRIKEITDVAEQLGKFKKRLFTKKPGEILVLSDFLKTYDEFGNKVTELLVLVNNPTTAPSREALKKMKQLLRLYKQIQNSIESYGKTVHSFEDAPSLENENELTKKYLDVLTRQQVLKNRIALFNNALLVAAQDGSVFYVDQIDKEYSSKLRSNDAKIKDEKVSAAVRDIRDTLNNRIQVFSATPQNIQKYHEQLFDKSIQIQSGTNGGSQIPDDGGGYEV